MSIKLSLRSICFLTIIISSTQVLAVANTKNTDERNVIKRVKRAELYIQQHGKYKAIEEFKKHAKTIFAIDYNGVFLASPIYPQLIGTNQINFKDPSGALVVQEEIEKAKAGGGWLKGRWRMNPQTGKYACRKIYIDTMPGDYFIGSWYYYAPPQKGECLI